MKPFQADSPFLLDGDKVHSKEEIPILAIIKGCTTADMLKPVRFGITDYIHEKCNLNELQNKMKTMLRIVKWKRQYIGQ